MHCRRCKVKMAEERGTHHKQKRWKCPTCGRRRMEAVAAKRKVGQRRGDRASRDHA